MRQKNRFDDTPLPMPNIEIFPEDCRGKVEDLFDTWHSVRQRNATLTTFVEMKNQMRDLGISIPPQLVNTNSVVGWASKAVQVRAVRSIFDGFVFGGTQDEALNALVRDNRLRTKYGIAVKSMLTHGLSTMTVMAGAGSQPRAMVRVFTANQSCVLWDKDGERVDCGVVLADVDRDNRACKYVFHFADCVIVARLRQRDEDGAERWEVESVEENVLGRPTIECLVHDADADRPLGHSVITPEIMGIIEKAMRDVLRMEVGAEFFTAPQRYILGADEDLFTAPPEEGEPTEDADGNPIPRPIDHGKIVRAYLGSFLALTRDENGDIPTVGQFPASDVHNFIATFENDAQRFSGAANVPLGQLGVLSNTYTSSDALGAANDPLILEVEAINARNKESMESIARMMMAIDRGVPLDRLPSELMDVQACFKDPSQPTIAARADAWTKIAAQDQSIVGTRVYYEGLGFPQATIDRLMQEKRRNGAISTLNAIADKLGVQT